MSDHLSVAAPASCLRFRGSSSGMRPVCQRMVDQTLETREALGAWDTPNSEIANCGHDPGRSYAFRPAPAKLAFGDDTAHSITSSARARMEGGTVMPSAFAGLRL